MRTGIVTWLLLFATTFGLRALVCAQSYYYYSHGGKIPLTLSEEEVTIKFKEGNVSSQIKEMLSSEPLLEEPSMLRGGSCKDFFSLRLKGKTDVGQLVTRLRKNPVVEVANPVFLFQGEMRMQVLDRFVAQFKSSVSKGQIDSLNAQHHVEIVSANTVSSYIPKLCKDFFRMNE
jgi:hypothetical protein